MCGVFLTISVFVLVLTVGSKSPDLGIPIVVLETFGWIFFWTDIILKESPIWLTFLSNIIVYSTLSYMAVSWLVKKEYLA